MNLFPQSQRPYYIYTPSYTHKSSGVRTLHALCHALNEMGQKAYIWPDNGNDFATNPALNTPLIEPQHHNFYKQNLDVIVVYPDIVRGNPLSAKHVVRYLMAPTGAYGGSSEFPESDNIWGGLPSISSKVLRIPVSDPEVFYGAGVLGYKRAGSCFYSHKYEMHGNKLPEMPPDCERVCGTLEQVADTLRRKEVCYLYELSSVITEAALCGCPIVLKRTEYFNQIDNACMMGDVRWDDGEIVKQCGNYLPGYNQYIADFEGRLKEFIKDTQEMAGG